MAHYKKILVIADPAMRVTTAMQRGMALARKTGAKLHLAVFDHNTRLLRARFLDPAVLKNAIRGYIGKRHDWLQSMAREYEGKGIATEISAHWGAPVYEEIVRFVLEHEPDLVVKDVDAKKKMTKMLFKPADWNLLRHCPTELMLVNPHATAYPGRIVAAIDPFHLHGKPHELNERIVRSALSMAYQCDAELEVVHAYSSISTNVPLGMEVVLESARVFESNRDEYEKVFRKFGEEHGIPKDKMFFLEGEPEAVLPRHIVKRGADLLVMGSVYRTGLEQIFIGGTAERILDKLKCDVLIMKPEGFEKDLERELARRMPATDERGAGADIRRYSL